jgi:hypothetical protein
MKQRTTRPLKVDSEQHLALHYPEHIPAQNDMAAAIELTNWDCCEMDDENSIGPVMSERSRRGGP